MSGSGNERPRPRRKRRRRKRETTSSPRKQRAAGRAKTARLGVGDAPTGWRNPNMLMPVSATVLMLGLALVGLGPDTLGAGLTLLGAAAFFYSIHKYGRLGPDRGRKAA